MSEATPALAQHLQTRFGLTLETAAPMAMGVMNRNLLVRCAEGRFVARQYRWRALDELDYELGLLAALATHDFPSPRPLTDADGQQAALLEGLPCIVYPYMAGQPQELHGPPQLQQVGAHLGRLHSLLREHPDRSREAIWDPAPLLRLVRQQGPQLVAAGFPEAACLLTFLEQELTALPSMSELPTGVTHQDVKPENVLFEKGRLTGFIDFDNAYHGALLHDLTTTAIWTCFPHNRLSRPHLDALLGSYIAERPLQADEERLLPHALRFRLLREAFIGPLVTQHKPALSKGRSDHFLALYRGLDLQDPIT